MFETFFNKFNIPYGLKYVGNPLSIGTKQLTWEGRRLKQIIDGTNTFTYSYNEQGLRTKKNINSVETKYHLQGSIIIAEEKNGQTIHYIYNEQNQLVGFEHQQSKYFYVRDLLGIIRNIIDVNGNIVVTYKYDAWGNHKVYDSTNAENTSLSFIGNINPFRYKGYYYDVETAWYYLQSRYYSPLLSRFINMDNTQYLEPGNVNGINLFAYCGNNPVLNEDGSGSKWWKKALMVIGSVAMVAVGVGLIATGVGAIGGAALIVAGVGSLIGGVVSENNGGSFVEGWIAGGIIGAGVGAGGGYALPAITSFASTTFSVTVGQGLSMSGGALAMSGGLTISITGAQVIGGTLSLASALGAYMFASTNRPGNNTKQNQQIKDAVRNQGIDPKSDKGIDLINEVHKYIRKNKLDLGWKELIELIKSFF